MFKICYAGTTLPENLFENKTPEHFKFENPTLIYGSKYDVIKVRPIFRSWKSTNIFLDTKDGGDAIISPKYRTLFINSPIFNFSALLLLDTWLILLLMGVV